MSRSPEDQNVLAGKTVLLRERSGSVTNGDYLILFLYLLARNELPVGTIEGLLGEVEIAASHGESAYTNGWLATWAEDAAWRLRGEIA